MTLLPYGPCEVSLRWMHHRVVHQKDSIIKKSHPSHSLEGFVEKENSVEVNWKQLSIDSNPHNFSNYEMETYFLELDWSQRCSNFNIEMKFVENQAS